jgi:cellobiose-specific phosphotransferase system component IIB
MKQIRVAICCGEGFSSGYLAAHLNIFAAQEGISDKVLFTRIPYIDLYAHQDEFDIAMLLPVVEYKAKADQKQYRIPLYLIPYKVIVYPKASDFVEDAADILTLANGKGGLIHFPDEPRAQSVTRLVSHRRWIAEHLPEGSKE